MASMYDPLSGGELWGLRTYAYVYSYIDNLKRNMKKRCCGRHVVVISFSPFNFQQYIAVFLTTCNKDKDCVESSYDTTIHIIYDRHRESYELSFERITATLGKSVV